MSYTAYDPEYLNRDLDPSPLASATTSSQLSKSKKKPWSKFKSSISSLGKKMSAKPTFAEQTESSEQKRVKKSKKLKNNSAGDSTASSSQDNLREKSPSKGSKSLIKKLSVDSIATPFVGLQPSAVSSTKTYAKALTKSASTSESNLSTSDNDTPKKSLTLDKNTKYNLSSQESPDSGRASQTMDGSRSSSQAGTQKEVTSDLSVDSDYTSPQHSGVKQEVQLGSLVAKTEQLAQSLVPPKGKEKKLDVSFEFIKAETVLDPKLQARQVQKSGDGSKIENKSDSTKNGLESSNKDITENTPKPSEEKKSEPKADLNESSIDEAEGRKKNKDITVKKASTSSDFITSEQTKAAKDDPKKTEASAQKSYEKPSLDEKSEKAEDKTVGAKSEESEKKPVLAVKTDESKEKSVLDTKSEKDKENSSGDKSVTDAKKGALANIGEGLILEKIVEQPTPESKTPKADKPVPEVKTSESEEKTKNNADEKESDPTNDDPSTITSQNDHETPSSSTEKVDEKLSEDGISSSSPPMDPLSIPDPLKNVGLPSDKDQKMSVDEKLEAFLSAEGWSGTIKDTAAKSSADGSQQPDKRECLYKILVIGELGTGKTSIIKRYVHQFFSQHYRATIGVDFALKVLNWDPNTIIRLQLWDIAGQERFGNMTRVYYKEAVGAFIVFDVTRSATFDAVLKWKQDLDSKVQLADGSPIPCVLLANKCDQQKEGVVNSPARMEEYCKDNNFSAWFETSAKENINIDEAAKSLVTQILQNDKMSQNGRDSARDGSQFPLENKSEDEGRSCAC